MILVTGATGFIGRRLVRRLAERHGAAELVCLVWDASTAGVEAEGRALLDALGVRSLPVDLVTGRGLGAVPRRPELVYHLASDIETGHEDHRIDDLGTEHLVAALGSLDARTRVVYTSSIAVVDHRAGAREGVPAHAASALARPYSEYGRRKLAAEAWLTRRAAAAGFSLQVSRLCAIHGRGNRAGGVFARSVALARADTPLARLDYPGMLSLMHVDDAVELLLELGTCPLAAGATEITMPAAESLPLWQVLRAIYAALGKPYRAIRLPASFWRRCNAAAYDLFSAERFLPHAVANRAWQLGLTVTPSLCADPRATLERWPNRRFGRFEELAHQLLG